MIPDATVRFSFSSGSFLNFSSKIRGQVGPGGWYEPCKVTNLMWDMRKDKEAEVHDQQNLEVLESLSLFWEGKKKQRNQIDKDFFGASSLSSFFFVFQVNHSQTLAFIPYQPQLWWKLVSTVHQVMLHLPYMLQMSRKSPGACIDAQEHRDCPSSTQRWGENLTMSHMGMAWSQWHEEQDCWNSLTWFQISLVFFADASFCYFFVAPP